MLPSEYFRRNIRFTTQPLEQPEIGVEHLWSILDAMYGRETLMFASDYPHWDYDDVKKLHIPPEWRNDVLGNNALKVYRRLQTSNAIEAPVAETA
jgi:predicted TIM-barrel fold metal-dependent hydrolase